MKKDGLWTRDYTRITLASILSIIGGEAINLPVSLLVFDETKSTLLSALVMMCGFLPDLLLGVLVSMFSAILITRFLMNRFVNAGATGINLYTKVKAGKEVEE